MSDFVTQDIVHELWNEIVKRHWAYFDTEESIVKLEKRKQLEDCLKEFLCIVQHDRKFFLPETAKVLKNSIRDLEDFSAQKAITAFESISQYANNLFTKPWRKEFRILKMYSGFYQHEIKSNLLDAEKLFEAMGYRRLSDDTLILDGPICPDQVTNVSRDAMTAYVELQIIKHIYTGLDTIGINCSWLDIFRYREKYTGGASQAVKALAYSVEEKRFRSRQKALAGDNYGYIDVQPSSNYFTSTNTQFCPAQCQCNLYQQQPPVSRHRPMPQPNGMCCVPEHHQQQQQSSRTTSNLVYSNMAYPPQHHYQHNHHHGGILNDSGGVPMSQMSHSRSLEHYSEPASHHHNILPHRHSFDHQQQGCTGQHHQQQPHQPHHYYQHLNQQQQHLYETPYDCIDGNSMGGGSSTISYAAVTANAVAGTATSGVVSGGGSNCNLNSNSTYSHPYNVSGNRFPLPLNISNQLSAYDNIQSSNYVGPQEPTYAHIADQHMYSSVSKLPQNCMLNSAGYNQTNHIHGVQNPSLAKESLQRQRSYQPEQLINFEDPSIMPPTTPQQFDPLNPYRHGYESSNHIMDKRYNMGNIMESPLVPPAASSCQQQQHYATTCKPTVINDDFYVYAKPTPRENRKPLQNAMNVRKSSYNSADRGDTTDISYESANDDFMNLPPQENERSHLRSPTQFTKNQDGVGSFESWNYVFQNLERSGYSKDLGEREDFLVKSLDLDSLNINNDTSTSQSSSAEKRRSNYAGNDNKTTIQQQQQQVQPQQEPKQKSRTFENTKYSSKNNTKMEITASASSSINGSQRQKTSMDNNTKKIKSALKQTNETSKSNTNNINPNHHPNKTQPKTNDNKTPPKTMNNNNNDSVTNTANGSTQRKKSSTSTTTRKTTASVGSSSATPNATQIIVSSPSEWSCSFCTFLNPNTKRICEMCCRSKDFNLDSSTTSTAAGGAGTSVAHNTPTCA